MHSLLFAADDMDKVSIEVSKETKEPTEMDTEVINETIFTELQTTTNESLEKFQNSSRKLSDYKVDVTAEFLAPGPLMARGHEIGTIMDLLESLLINVDGAAGKRPNVLPQLEPVVKAVLNAHSLAAYVSHLDRAQLQKLTARIISDTTLWISRLFRFFDCSACFHDEPWEGLVRLCRALLRLRYPKYDEEGYEVLYSRPPVIYVSSLARSGIGQHLCNKLGLPQSCISVVPCNTVFGSQYKMDVSQLEQLIQEDFSAQKTPLLVIASAGAAPLGQVDNLQRIQEICKAQDLWLHVEGQSLAGLCLVSAPTLPAKVGDSMTLPLGQWLGIISIPNVTLFKTLDPNVSISADLTVSSPQKKLTCLPLWFALQSLGQDGVTSRIQHAFQLSRHFHDKLCQLKNIKLIGRDQMDRDSKPKTVSELASKAVSTSVLLDILIPTIVFQYIGIRENKPDFDGSSMENSNCGPAYLNSLNSWLGQILQRDIHSVAIDIIQLDNGDVCLRYSPLIGYKTSQVKTDVIDLFVNCVAKQAEILNATVKHREEFPKLISQHPNIQVVELSDWAGLGGVRYIPKNWVGNLSDLPDTGKEEVNKINQELVILLKNSDSAFSLGEGDDGLYCVRFGMVTEETDMQELLHLIVDTGEQMEEMAKYFETMSEMIKKGIETADEDLKKENEERIWQDGLLRHVPVVSSLYNWWAPLPKESGVKGRSFNLSSGVIESTENIYKYHMQIKQGSPVAGPSTPKPVVQTPVVITPDHSRTSSKSSTGNPQDNFPIPSDEKGTQEKLVSEGTAVTEP